MDSIQCFGVSWMGECSIDHLTTNTPFNIGVYIGAISLLLAVYQLIDEKHKFRIALHFKFSRIVNCIVIGFILSFIGYILPHWGGDPFPFLGYPIIWEILSLCMFSVVFYFLLKVFFQPKKITRDDIPRLLEIIREEIIKGEKGVIAVSEELSRFIEAVVDDFIENYSYEGPISESEHILRMISDKGVCMNVAESNPFVFLKIFRLLTSTKYGGKIQALPDWRRGEVFGFVRMIFMYSLSQKNSLIYREIQGESFEKISYGKGLFTNEILDDFSFVKSFDLFSIHYGDPISSTEQEIYDKSFIKVWENCIDQYFKSINKNFSNAHYLSAGFERIAGILKRYPSEFGLHYVRLLPYMKDDTQELIQALYDKKPYKNQLDIDFGEYYTLAPEPSDLYPSNTDLARTCSLGIFSCIDSLLVNRNEKDYFILRSGALSIYPDKLAHSGFFYGLIRGQIKKLILMSVKKNMEGFHRPNGVNIFFNLYGFTLFENKTSGKFDVDFFLKILSVLAEGLPKVVEGTVFGKGKGVLDESYIERRSERLLDALFPDKDHFYYDSKKHRLVYYFGDKSHANMINLYSHQKDGKILVQKFQQ